MIQVTGKEREKIPGLCVLLLVQFHYLIFCLQFSNAHTDTYTHIYLFINKKGLSIYSHKVTKPGHD